MGNSLPSPEPATARLHPLVYVAVAGAFIWLVTAAWVFFGGWGQMGLNLAIVSTLVFMAGGIPFVLWRANVRARRRAGEVDPTLSLESGEGERQERFDVWIRGNFDTWSGQQKSRLAAIEILLPLAAAAVGMTLLGIVFEIAQRHQI